MVNVDIISAANSCNCSSGCYNWTGTPPGLLDQRMVRGEGLGGSFNWGWNWAVQSLFCKHQHQTVTCCSLMHPQTHFIITHGAITACESQPGSLLEIISLLIFMLQKRQQHFCLAHAAWKAAGTWNPWRAKGPPPPPTPFIIKGYTLTGWQKRTCANSTLWAVTAYIYKLLIK